MDGVERGGKWKILKERLGFIACCGGPTWGSSNMTVRDEEEEEDDDEQDQEVIMDSDQIQNQNGLDLQDCVGQIPASGMNLATALAAERHYRTEEEENNIVGPTTGGLEVGRGPGSGRGPETPSRMSLMRLLEEEGDGVDEEKEKGRNDTVCCVCMRRNKGAAFIPCGHTFCRVCSREIWLNRGSCPLCNRSILEILDIF